MKKGFDTDKVAGLILDNARVNTLVHDETTDAKFKSIARCGSAVLAFAHLESADPPDKNEYGSEEDDEQKSRHCRLGAVTARVFCDVGTGDQDFILGYTRDETEGAMVLPSSMVTRLWKIDRRNC